MYRKYLAPILIVVLVAVTNAGTYLAMQKDTDQKVEALQRQISSLQETLGVPSSDTAVLPKEEAERRQAVRAQSQDDLLTEAVAKVTPAVVSIVISKDVPQLEVVYENPFGDDPFFQDFGFRIPTYRQKGTVRQKVGGGTGFIIRSDGYIVTNRHVVADSNASYTALLSNGQQKPIQVIYKDPKHDLALVKIDGNGYTSLSLGDSGNLKLGQTVIAIGNALAEYNNSVSVGIISGLNRSVEATDNNGRVQTLTGVIQTDAAINPGNSGGPLIDLNGRVVGVNVATAVGANSISFSIPINEVKVIINTVIK